MTPFLTVDDIEFLIGAYKGTDSFRYELAKEICAVVNAKVEAAPEVFCTAASDAMALHNKTIWDGTLTIWCDTHTARLVCVEEIK